MIDLSLASRSLPFLLTFRIHLAYLGNRCACCLFFYKSPHSGAFNFDPVTTEFFFLLRVWDLSERKCCYIVRDECTWYAETSASQPYFGAENQISTFDQISTLKRTENTLIFTCKRSKRTMIMSIFGIGSFAIGSFPIVKISASPHLALHKAHHNIYPPTTIETQGKSLLQINALAQEKSVRNFWLWAAQNQRISVSWSLPFLLAVRDTAFCRQL